MRQGIDSLIANVRSVFFGSDQAIEQALTTLLAGGHLLIEDLPGVGKTLLARALAQSFHLDFRRIQFTPDLLPTDVTGLNVFDPRERVFSFIEGPVFTNVLLADEINRASPKTQSALLEAMEERQVSVDGKPLPLPEPFFVIATQNPIELAGTYPLPEAQLDRFLMRVSLGYPTPEDEARILESHRLGEPVDRLGAVMDREELLALIEAARRVEPRPAVRDYVVRLANATRQSDAFAIGLSPRGSLALMRAAQALSLLRGRDYVSPDAVQDVALPVMSHRLVVSSQAHYAGGEVCGLIQEILDRLPVPTLESARSG